MQYKLTSSVSVFTIQVGNTFSGGPESTMEQPPSELSTTVPRTYDPDGFRRRAGVIAIRAAAQASCCTQTHADAPSTGSATVDDVKSIGLDSSAPAFSIRNLSDWDCLMVTSSVHPDRLVFPAGGIDPGEDESTAASREAMEEAGIRGCVHFLAAVDNADKRTRTHFYVMFLDEMADTWLEAHIRKRCWRPLPDALRAVFADEKIFETITAALASVPVPPSHRPK